MNSVVKVFVALFAATAIAVTAYFYYGSLEPEQVDTIAVEEVVEFQPIIREPASEEVMADTTSEEPVAEPEEEKVEEPTIELPALAQSDSGWREAAHLLSPRIASWLVPEQQIRKWVAAIDNLATEQVPAEHRPLLYPIDEFVVSENDDVIHFDPKSYQRTNSIINSIIAIPVEDLAKSYYEWQPLLEEAYAELGYEHSFHQRFLQALNNILAIESIEQPQELVQPSVFYLYRDKELEQASTLDKLFWRIGPDNTQKLQRYINDLKPLLN